MAQKHGMLEETNNQSYYAKAGSNLSALESDGTLM